MLSHGACEVIKGFYLILRENSPNSSFQITNRHLESMIRLTMARARVDCRTEATEEDAIVCFRLCRRSPSSCRKVYSTPSKKWAIISIR